MVPSLRPPSGKSPSQEGQDTQIRAAADAAAKAARGRAGADGGGFGIYVHWPFCQRKCPYCDFNSHVLPRNASSGEAEAAYLAALKQELAASAAVTKGREVTSIFIGGGTPSLLSAAATGTILESIARYWTIAARAEITLEANPGSADRGRFLGYRSAGVNRLSIGVQALSDRRLRALGRIHGAAEARAAVAAAQAVFSRSSFDLIYALPGETPASWKEELREALALAPNHLSLYQLTIEPETAFARWQAAGKLTPLDEEAAASLYEMTQEMTVCAGLPAYEISNHARPGEESRHNLLYWRYGEYAGVGPGAHSRLVIAGRRHALANERDPFRWQVQVAAQGMGTVETIVLTPREESDERLLMGLRLAEGVDLEALQSTTGLVPDPETVARLIGSGLAAYHPGTPRLAATAKGRLVLDTVIARLSDSLGPAREGL